MTRLEEMLNECTTREQTHDVLRICDRLYKGDAVVGYSMSDLPPDDVYERYVIESNYVSDIIIRNIDVQTKIIQSPRIIAVNQILNSFIFNRYEFNRQHVAAIVMTLIDKRIENIQELLDQSGDIKVKFNLLVERCKDMTDHELYKYFIRLGTNCDVINDLVDMIHFAGYGVDNVCDEWRDRPGVYINKSTSPLVLTENA